jgi:hypothetical protein
MSASKIERPETAATPSPQADLNVTNDLPWAAPLRSSCHLCSLSGQPEEQSMTEHRNSELKSWAQQLREQASDPRLSRAEREHIRKVYTGLLGAMAESTQSAKKSEAA